MSSLTISGRVCRIGRHGSPHTPDRFWIANFIPVGVPLPCYHSCLSPQFLPTQPNSLQAGGPSNHVGRNGRNSTGNLESARMVLRCATFSSDTRTWHWASILNWCVCVVGGATPAFACVKVVAFVGLEPADAQVTSYSPTTPKCRQRLATISVARSTG
jgi:hypothetical protein